MALSPSLLSRPGPSLTPGQQHPGAFSCLPGAMEEDSYGGEGRGVVTLGTGPAPPLPFCLAAAQNFDPEVPFAPVCCGPRVTTAQRPSGTPCALGNTQVNQTQKQIETRRCRGGVWGQLCSEPTWGPRSPVGQSQVGTPQPRMGWAPPNATQLVGDRAGRGRNEPVPSSLCRDLLPRVWGPWSSPS